MLDKRHWDRKCSIGSGGLSGHAETGKQPEFISELAYV